MKDWKTLLTLPAMAALALCVALLTSSRSAAVDPPQEVRSLAGVLSGWQIDVDGTVYLRVRVTGEQQEELWFRTPDDKDVAARNVEELLTQALLVGYPGDEKIITVTAKRERSLDGKTPEHALPLLAVASR